MTTQFVTDENGKKIAVILPIKAYEALLENRENREAVVAYDKAKKGKLEFINATTAFKEIEQNR
jgi:hypothetical protein